MELNKGIKAQDIAVLLTILVYEKELTLQEIGNLLKISKSGIFYSLQRSSYSGLYIESNKLVKQNALFEFIKYGLPYVFPLKVGGLTKGIPTSISAFPLNKYFTNETKLVWPSGTPTTIGMFVEPLYPSLPDAIINNEKLYSVFSLIEAIRIGHTREKQKALVLLEKLICNK
jgi:hypothetical protein